MKGLVRIPIDMELSTEEQEKITKAYTILSQYGWNKGIEVCMQNKDMESLVKLPALMSIYDHFLSKTIPIFTVGIEKKIMSHNIEFTTA